MRRIATSHNGNPNPHDLKDVKVAAQVWIISGYSRSQPENLRESGFPASEISNISDQVNSLSYTVTLIRDSQSLPFWII